MAFNQATWIDRDSEHPNRRTLTNVNDTTDVKTYDLSRAEGTVTTQGTPIGASTMNDLETRIASAFTEVNNNMPVANPSGEATEELEKIKIGNTIFSVEGTSVEEGKIQNVAIASFSDGADNVPVSSLIVDIDAVQAGSGTPSPSNPRAISGWSECNIHKSGINLWDEEWELGVWSAEGTKKSDNNAIRSKNYIAVVPNLKIRLISPVTLVVRELDINKNVIRTSTPSSGQILILSPNTKYIVFCSFMVDNITSYSGGISFNYPSTDTSYHAYNGNTYKVDFGQTVYGGTLNVTTGLLTITHGIKDLGTLNYNYDSSIPRFWTNEITDIKSPSTNAIVVSGLADIYKVVSFDDLYYRYKENGTLACSSAGVVSIINTAYTDAPTFKTAMSGVQLVYELATPTTVQLTPTEIRTLLGNNNIFADTGNINELVYFKTGCEAIARLIEAYECYTDVEGTLAAGQTSITLTNDAITSNSTIDVYTDADVDYNSITVTTGSVTITFEAQASNMKVKARIS